MDDVLNFVSSVIAMINACEDYKRLDASNDLEAMQAESITYNGIREKMEAFRGKLGGSQYVNKND